MQLAVLISRRTRRVSSRTLCRSLDCFEWRCSSQIKVENSPKSSTDISAVYSKQERHTHTHKLQLKQLHKGQVQSNLVHVHFGTQTRTMSVSLQWRSFSAQSFTMTISGRHTEQFLYIKCQSGTSPWCL